MSNDIIDIKKININDPAEVEGAAEVIIAYDLFVEAYLLYAKLCELESTRKGAGAGSDNDTLLKLKWIALPKFGQDEIAELFKSNFTKIFEIEDYDLWTKLKQKIIADIWYEDRDGFKEKLRKALLKNEEYLTKEKIIINGREEPPTVGNWLKDYNVALGLEPVDVAKQSQYLTNSKNMRGLGGISNFKSIRQAQDKLQILKEGKEGREGEEGGKIGEKDKLKILFQLYEKLKISSLTPAGLEEGLFIDEDGVKGVLDDGVFTKIDPAMEKHIKDLQKIIDGGVNNPSTKKDDIRPADEKAPQAAYLKEKVSNAYIFSVPEQEIIKQEEEDIRRIARGNVLLIGKELTRALEQKNRLRVVAALRLAVKNNLLIGWAGKNQENNKTLKQENKDIVITFLIKVLQNKLGLSEHEAAKIGVHLYNLFKKQGRDVGYLAYFDEGDGRFRWYVERK